MWGKFVNGTSANLVLFVTLTASYKAYHFLFYIRVKYTSLSKNVCNMTKIDTGNELTSMLSITRFLMIILLLPGYTLNKV